MMLISFEMKFEESRQYKKGSIGEGIVRAILEEKGYVVYNPTADVAHSFDFLAVKNKRRFLIAEVKTKARLNFFPATGFNKKHYDDYLFAIEAHKINVLVFFVDEHPKEERIYYGVLSEMVKERFIDGKEYPLFMRDVVVFPLSIMHNVRRLTKEELSKLKGLSSRSYNYE